MRALMLRHLTLNRRMLLQLAPLFLVWLAVGCAKAQAMSLVAGLMLGLSLSAFVLLNGEALDPNLERFLLSLPVSRARVVRDAYVSGLLALLVGLALPILMRLALHHLSPTWAEAVSLDFWPVALLVYFSGAGLVAYLLPFRFALGGPKGLLAFALSLVAIVVGIFAWKGMEGVMAGLTALSDRVLDHPVQGLIGALLAMGFLGLSLLVSTWAYERREL